MRHTLAIAFRNVLRQRTRTLLTVAAVALGVASVILSGGYVEDILVQLREATIRSELGHLQVYRAGQYASGGQRPFDFLIDDPAEVERAFRKIAGVVVTTRRLNFFGVLTNGRGELPIIGEGISPDAESRIGTAITMLSGRRLTNDDRFAIAIGEGLARAMKLRVDDRVNVVISTRDGSMNVLEFRIAGVFRTQSKEYDARAIHVPLAAAEELAGTSGVSAVVALLSDTNASEASKAALSAELPASRYEVKAWYDLADFYNSTAALYKRQFAVLQVIILVMVLLGVANTITVMLHERTAEFGIMRALGRRGTDVFRLAVLEAAVLGVAGAFIGVGLGVAVGLVVSYVGISMPPPPNSESGFTAAIRLVPGVIAAAFVLGLAGAVTAALIPARRIARVPVVDALREAI